LIQEPAYSIIALAARICLSAVFLVSGIHKTLWYVKALEEFRAASVPIILLTLPLIIALHIVASVCILSGIFFAQAALSLAAFTLIATLWVFPFWRRSGTERLDQSRIALTNIGLTGGLLMLFASGPGQYVLFS
jgi:putative oxidoreductase